jgi:glycosyltransferase involved in cell wall biosynthesis
MACGTPVIAYGRGGVTETVIPLGGRKEPTGLFFTEQTADCLTAALSDFEAHVGDFNPTAARRQAVRFNAGRFQDELFAYLDGVLRPTVAPARRAA